MSASANKTELLPYIAYAVVALTWGTTYLAINLAVAVFPPGLFSGIRFTIAGAIMLLIAKALKLSFPTDSRQWLLNALPGLLIICGTNGIVMYISRWVGSGIISVFIASIPLFIALLELSSQRQNILKPLGWFSLILSFGGVLLIAFDGNDIGTIDGRGLLWICIALMFGAVGAVATRKFSSGHALILAGTQMLAGGIAMLLFGLSLGELGDVSYSTQALLAMLYLIVFGSLLGYGCYVYLLTTWPATIVSTVSYINTVIALLLGIFILREPITTLSACAAVAILIGVYGVQKNRKK